MNKSKVQTWLPWLIVMWVFMLLVSMIAYGVHGNPVVMFAVNVVISVFIGNVFWRHA